MKKLVLGAAIFAAGLFNTTNAQIQKDNWMVGGQVAKIGFSPFQLNLTPQVGYFIKDNWAVGAQVGLDLISTSGVTSTNWDIGAFTRYYFGPSEITTLLKNGRFFAQGNVGIGGNNVNKGGSSTNGLALGAGAGYSYFISRNVSLDALLKFDAKVGGGSSSTKGNVGLAVGFQIFLPTAKVKDALRDK